MYNQILITLNFWESKQVEYWLKDNCPSANIRSLYDKYTSPDEPDQYSIEGKLDNETACMLKLKYGEKIKGVR